MDARLKDASTNGDVSALDRLLQENPLILQNAHSNCLQTPVHIAAVMGHAKFVMAVVGHNRNWARQPNLEGQTPIHLASAKGHLEIVKHLLAFDVTLAHLRDRDGRNFLHSAAVGLQLSLFIELFTPESILELTASGETILHLAVKNNQYKALASLISIIRSHNLDRILNISDEEGNTILHCACLRQQDEIVKLLVEESNVEVNAVNSKGLSALDIVLSDTNSSNMKQILTGAGAVGRKRLAGQRAQARVAARAVPKSERLIDALKNGIMLMAVMFATLTFQMAMNPPGGFWQDMPSDGHINSSSDLAPVPVPAAVKGEFFSPWNLVFVQVKKWNISYIHEMNTHKHKPGKAISRELDRRLFAVFLLYDAVCFFTSLSMIVVLAVIETLNWDNNVAAIVMLGLTANLLWFAGLTFRTGIALVTDDSVSLWVSYAALYNLGVTLVFWGLALLFLFFLTRFALSYLHTPPQDQLTFT